MNFPPFPPQDLAKLVLGYLVEEQLMTAYDEFLQTSPYLDAMRNEYDRISLTSLRYILAERRAVLIFVESCKPISLRKRLLQCANLLDMVKFLVNIIDINKLHGQESEKTGEKQVFTSSSKVSCEACNALKLPSCVCKRQHSFNSSNEFDTQLGASTSVEATSLADLPGSYATARKKHMKILERGSGMVANTSNSQYITVPSSENIQPKIIENNTRNNVKEINSGNKLESNALTVPSNENVAQSYKCNNLPECDDINHNVCDTTNYPDFTAGVTGGHIQSIIVPDSISSANSCVRTPIQKETSDTINDMRKTRHQFLLKVSAISENKESKSKEVLNINTVTYSTTNQKSEDPKIKILSDVKVDNLNDKQNKIPAVVKNITSTPLTQMQTIVINGAPAYKHQPLNTKLQNFTKDEIMAMPTLIVVPSSSVSMLHSKTSQCVAESTAPKSFYTQANTQHAFSPLVIDVTASPCENDTNLPEPIRDSININEAGIETGLIQTVNCHKNTSLPKDNTVPDESSTPQVLPLLRKASSTPRRNSHIRVLDFTTPRRILHETPSEQGEPQNSECPVEVVISGSPDYITQRNGHDKNITVEISNNDVDNMRSKENDPIPKTVKPKKNNWDADLRALVATDASNNEFKPGPSKSRRCRKKTLELKRIEETASTLDTSAAVGKTKCNTKIKRKQIIEEEEPETLTESKSGTLPVKPTINIKPGHDWGAISQENKKHDENTENKANTEENNETPEVERLSLQNDIGGKLNISDIFETPFKQAFYDIQMETPRFLRLGPDLPDEPLSEIKIMNIPTPRFFDTPKLFQNTPSSYSSRPTDYSSGGSYYKPDDQDYIPSQNLLCPVSSIDEAAGVLPRNTENNKKHSRPTRKCTKNVSYYNNKSLQEKTTLEKTELDSNNSDTTSVNSSLNKNINHDESNPTKNSKINMKSKTQHKKRNSIKKTKTPVKKEKPKTFMKIKPRRMTPTKEAIGGRGRKRLDKTRNDLPAAKRGSSKEKSNSNSLISSAPTKSRRKSSTPRKLHCSKTFNSESSGHDSPGNVVDRKEKDNATIQASTAQDSDTEQLTLRWSDDGSHDAKLKDEQEKANDIEDVSKIQAYIETTVLQRSKPYFEQEGKLKNDLIERGFDAETAKILERDLLDTPPHSECSKTSTVKLLETLESKKDEVCLEGTVGMDSSLTNTLQIVDEIEYDIELSVQDCNEESDNYVMIHHDDTSVISPIPSFTLRDTYEMEICVADEEIIVIRPTPFTLLIDDNFEAISENYIKETQDAVNSISNYDKLYTPLKESIKAQCYEIFDSTLTSLDTPLKGPSSPKAYRQIVMTEIVLEEEKIDVKETKKRKRLQNSNSSEESVTESKRTKTDPNDLLKATNIQNIDIETVLTKLHGH